MGEQRALWAHRAGRAALRDLPGPAAYALAAGAAREAARRGGPGVARMRASYSLVRPELGAEALDTLVIRGMELYARYWCDLFRAGRWSDADVDRLFRTENEERARDALAGHDGRGVLVLGHLGNWDLAGRWAGRHLQPVTAVAERLRPEALFQEFVATRRSMGIDVLPLTGGDPPFPALRRVVRSGGLAALVADRDLSGSGVHVDLCGHQARVAAGPAALARAEDAALLPVFLRTDETDRSRAERRTVARFGAPIQVARSADAAADVASATQEFAVQLGAFLREHTADWHMLQPVFVEDAR